MNQEVHHHPAPTGWSLRSFTMLWWPYATWTICVPYYLTWKHNRVSNDDFSKWGKHEKANVLFYEWWKSVPASYRLLLKVVLIVLLYKYIVLLWLDGLDLCHKLLWLLHFGRCGIQRVLDTLGMSFPLNEQHQLHCDVTFFWRSSVLIIVLLFSCDKTFWKFHRND